MRRKEREVVDAEKINEIILNCDCCRIALNTDKAPYIVPLNFGYASIEDVPTFYFHGAKEGRKITLIHNNPFVGFELDTNGMVVGEGEACEYSYYYQSVIGTGKVTIVEDLAEKLAGLQLIMKHYTQKDEWDIPERALQATTIFKLEVEEMSCKEHTEENTA